MATNPGVLTNWPWKPLGNFKYVILAPWVVHSTYCLVCKGEKEADLFYFLIFPFLLTRFLHNQIWVSYSRYRTAKGNNRIVDKGIEFEQVDRESNWDDQIILNGLLFYLTRMIIPIASHLPIWRSDGVIITILLHAGPVEFLYYWLHRALHHHYLYPRYHSHHHSSIATEPITSVIHPFAEEVAYFLLFAIPLLTTVFTGTGSLLAAFGYITYIDLMNNMGHCNFELVPNWVFSIFPPLKYFMYTPTYHSLHHTQFRTNYSLFMPVYDYIYATVDKSSDALYESSLKRHEESPDIVYLTHLTTIDSIYHLRLGFASLASKPFTSKWYLMAMWPVTCWSVVFTRIYCRTFISERNALDKLKLQSWVIPRYTMHYLLGKQKEVVSNLIEEAILEADKKGAKVLSLGLLNQNEDLNGNGELYIQRHPKLKIKLVDGSSLAAAVVVNSIPEGTNQVLLGGKFSKVSYAIALALCQKDVQVATTKKDKYKQFEQSDRFGNNLVLPDNYDQKIWVVGEGFTEREQLKAKKGTLFIPFSQFPPKKVRKDCYYHTTPAMVAPKSLENLHSCENWLPRRVMSAWRVAGIIHGLEGWNVHECGQTMFSMDKVWKASLEHGFRHLPISI
ncbi:protein ECERIFERUM 1-like isoform X1 [Durio zibethinus]|uniref:Protein ECERIFERUM 1-like isoform X1 n=1 Tax=Durio zibethinus TaxID=66656 RepID=A0A6P5XCV5_DURZI|nr:protein ECERIFERUM 1-like isoform X1 [Durio zibethinus]